MSDNAKDNFKAAFGELFGTREVEASRTEKVVIKSVQEQGQDYQEQVQQPIQQKLFKESNNTGSSKTLGGSVENSIITKDTVINGSITTKSNIEICGIVKGDVTSENNILITGKIEGNVTGNAIAIKTGAVKGNMEAKGKILLNGQATVYGNIEAFTVESDGKVKGDIKVSASISLLGNAVIIGNIISKNLIMQDGATIKGVVEILSDDIEELDEFSLEREI